MHMIVRKATAEEMLKLWGYQDADSASPTARFFHDSIKNGNAVFWTADNEGELIGELYGFLELDDHDFADGRRKAYLCAFRVRKQYRGQGYGSQLMAEALSELKKMGFCKATIGVGSDEPANQKMYRHFGFTAKIKNCHYDPCDRDENNNPVYDGTVWWLLEKDL